MTQLTLTRGFLKHSQPLLTKCLQAALIAAPVMLAAAPSHAAGLTVTNTVNGFTGAFARTNWSLSNGTSPANTVTFNPASGVATTLSIFKTNANGNTASAVRTINDALIDLLRPSGAGAFVGWTATGKYTWTGTNLGQAPRRLVFSGNSGTDGTTFSEDGAMPTPTSFSIKGIGPTIVEGETNDDAITFAVLRNGSTQGAAGGTGLISNFKFVAEYEVPGPLPIIGAAAAFAWSRKLRNRLQSANTLA